ncbi:MAG: hypothetical protein OEQ81_12990 [Flavobacteriaceae bacterium]|nr:hypothetical protein [Flavobacteriaceae bacterium]
MINLKCSLPFAMLMVLYLTMNSCNEQSSSYEESSSSFDEVPKIERNPIEGAWYLVWGEYNGNERIEDKPFQVKLFTEKHFSYLMKSDSIQWGHGTVGTYELENGIYREKFLYSTNSANMGLTAEWEYEVKGDSLFMNGPIKIINAQGVDISEQDDRLHSMKEVRTRAN